MTTKNLIALAVIAAGVYSVDQPEVAAGAVLRDVPADVADKMIAEGLAKEADIGAAAAADPAPAKKPGKTMRVRVLLDCALGKANEVIELPVDEARQQERAGAVDTDKAAVTYALTLRAA